jgi:hypothetical protein
VQEVRLEAAFLHEENKKILHARQSLPQSMAFAIYHFF